MGIETISPVSWIAGIILVFCAIRGLRRGMVRSVFATFSFIAALIIASVFSPRLNITLQSSFLYDAICERVESTVERQLQAETGEEDENQLIGTLPLPEFMRDILVKNNKEGVYETLGVDAFGHYISAYITRIILKALAYLLVFAAAVILLQILCVLLDAIAGLPVLYSLNKAGGFLFGVVNGVIVLWLLCSIAALFAGTQTGALINRQINESILLQYIYNKNTLLTLLAKAAAL